MQKAIWQKAISEKFKKRARPGRAHEASQVDGEEPSIRARPYGEHGGVGGHHTVETRDAETRGVGRRACAVGTAAGLTGIDGAGRCNTPCHAEILCTHAASTRYCTKNPVSNSGRVSSLRPKYGASASRAALNSGDARPKRASAVT